MVTLLDAHPDVSMGYEIYEHLLAPSQESGLHGIEDLVEQARRLAKKSTEVFGMGKKIIPRVSTFIARARRGGVSGAQVCKIIETFAANGGDIISIEDRLRLVKRIVQEKMVAEGKTHWGAKIAASFESTASLWPDSCFLFMMRDGRDIVASRKNNGDFKQSVEEVAEGYVQQVKKFQAFSDSTNAKTRIVHYESLAREPEVALRAIFNDIELPWSDSVLNHNAADLSLFRDPTGHLSANQVNKPINTGSIGRWSRDLTHAEIGQFEMIAGEVLDEYGYKRELV